MSLRHRALPLSLILSLFFAQLLLAWHAPSHILADSHGPSQELLASADCQVCTHGLGLLALPTFYFPPLTERVAHTPSTPISAPLQRSERTQHPPRGPPATV